MKSTISEVIAFIKFDKTTDGLVPAIVQDSSTKEVLMMGFMNRDALEKTIQTGLVTFWTRSRRKLWTKGETSGNILRTKAVRVNCNDDSLLILVEPVGATCHTGHRSCYHREYDSDRSDPEWRTVSEPEFYPDEVYSAELKGLSCKPRSAELKAPDAPQGI